MDMQVILSQMAVLFILIAIGYIAGKVKMLSSEGIKNLSRVVLNISTPSTILYSVLSDTGGITGSKSLYFMSLIMLSYAIVFFVAIPASYILGKSERSPIRDNLDSKTEDATNGSLSTGEARVISSNRGLYCSMIAFGNVGFMGFPISQAILGVGSMFYAALFNIIFNILTYSVGTMLISGKGGKINFKPLLNATLFSAIIAFFLVLTGIKAPKIINETISLASGMNTPCAMLVIGATLSRVSVKDVFSRWQLYPIAAIKMLIIPFLIWFVFKQFVADGMLLGVLVVLSSMPIAAAIAMLSIEYGADDRLASGSVFITTLLSAATIPLITYVLLM